MLLYWLNNLINVDQRPLGSSRLKMAYALSDKLAASELARAEEIAIGLPVPGQDLGTRISDTLRFPEYHEPIERWPFLADPILEKIRKHGRHPPLLTDRGRTKGVPNRRTILHTGPSDRIGSNLTPTAKHLRLKAIREERLRKARLRKLMKEEGLLRTPATLTPLKKVEIIRPTSSKKPLTGKFGKLISRPPKKPRFIELLINLIHYIGNLGS